MPTAPPPITRAIFPPASPASEAIREPPSVSAPDPVPAAPQDPTWFTDKRRLPEPSREISPPTLLNPRQRREPSSACRGDRPSDGIMCLDRRPDTESPHISVRRPGICSVSCHFYSPRLRPHLISLAHKDYPLAHAQGDIPHPVSYTHLRAHETVLDLVCRLLLE